jgi:hypothetical protein
VAFRLRPAAGSDSRSLGISVKRYTPQAVLIANVEEARCRALASEDGLLLVEAHYAVQQPAQLPEDHTAARSHDLERLGGRASPCGPVLPRARRCLALEESRAENAPTFVVRITYVRPVDLWKDEAHARLELPALDLPVSRTGVELYHSPRFKIALQPGTFRIESDPGVFA